ncbi:hypothetical protein LXL04_010184 [Taraxacum kok-saghyz]
MLAIDDEHRLSLLVAISKPKVIPNFKSLCAAEGFGDVVVRYVGGRWVMISFEGLPLAAWSDAVVELVVFKWGELMFVEDDADYPLGSRRVCIAYANKKPLTNDLLVKVVGVRYRVFVKELMEWEVEMEMADFHQEKEGWFNGSDVGSHGCDQEDVYEECEIRGFGSGGCGFTQRDHHKSWKDKVELVARAAAIDVINDDGLADPGLIQERRDVHKKLGDLESVEQLDVLQKMRINWAVEGDENTNFFHGMLNRKRNQLQIRGVLVDGRWEVDLGVVKNIFHEFLEKPVSEDELKDARGSTFAFQRTSTPIYMGAVFHTIYGILTCPTRCVGRHSQSVSGSLTVIARLSQLSSDRSTKLDSQVPALQASGTAAVNMKCPEDLGLID